MLLVGIDEVGYGCRLGPFIAAAVVFETPNPDLWTLLHPHVGRAPGEGIPVCDSKKIYTPSKGIRSLERTALSFLPAAGSLRELCSAVGVSPNAPWIDDADLELPFGGADVEADRATVRRALDHAGIRFLGAYARLLEAAEFNASLARLKNKHDLHVETVLGLFAHVLGRHDSLRATAQVGKLSARTFYLRPLTLQFQSPTFARRENKKISTYVMDVRGREVEISFILDGDESRFAIALASIVGKYLRECWMKLFNAYWAKRRSGLRPTAGYGTDARRFWGDIESVTGELTREQIYREK